MDTERGTGALIVLRSEQAGDRVHATKVYSIMFLDINLVYNFVSLRMDLLEEICFSAARLRV